MMLAVTPPEPVATAAGSVTVVVKNIDFTPHRVRIAAGGRVVWRFADRYTAHNVHSVGRKRFRSSADKRSGTYAVRFRRAGTYRYVCTIHYGMKGRVVVS